MNGNIYVTEAKRGELVIRESDVRYFLGFADKNTDGTLDALISECIAELVPVLSPRACFSYYSYTVRNGAPDLGFARPESRDLVSHLSGCDGIILLAATVGIGADRLVAKYGKLSPSRALVVQAAAAAAVESWLDILCENFEKEAKKTDNATRPRFSCGYGDLDLSLQRDIFRELDCEKRIGVTLTQGLLMTPTKSVTAIVGICKEEFNEN